MLEKCLERLEEDKSVNFLLFVHEIFYKIIRRALERNKPHVIEKFRDMLFISIHYMTREFLQVIIL
ncbi:MULTISPECIES: hypothetical protein [Borreliella]|uniref:hypothetical protein n=1 Tax=Borreliella TaxID=64895 RepID=UPI001E360DFA|nr:hypothetical protein [Borreliella bavariensis]